MNRYAGPPSKATSSTTCQKCLKKGHYSYECTASAQARPYASRPSRTQQLLNPKLKPKLASDTPNELLRKTGVADEQLAKAEEQRSRKRQRIDGGHSWSRSASESSSCSSPDSERAPNDRKSPPTNNDRVPEHITQSIQEMNEPLHDSQKVKEQKPPRHESLGSPPRCRRSSSESHRERRLEHGQHPEIRHPGSRSPSPRKYRRRSRERAERLDRSRSPRREHRERHNHDVPRRPSRERGRRAEPPAPRKRSLSPYSKRLFLTQSMNM